MHDDRGASPDLDGPDPDPDGRVAAPLFHVSNLTELPASSTPGAAKLLARLKIDFETQLATLSDFLEQRGFRHALVGGLALAAYGLARTTLDLDLAVEAASQPQVVAFLESVGYETLYRSEGYSNHLHPDPVRGRIDLVYIDPVTANALFPAARAFPGPAGRQILVPKPEHLAAMKVAAMKSDPSRVFQDLADVRFLLELPGVDREEIRSYFEKHGLTSRFHELEETL